MSEEIFFFGNLYQGVSVLEISIRYVAHELMSILMRRANSQYVCMYVRTYVCTYVRMYVCTFRLPEVPPLTKLKKLNKTFYTERFP